MKAYRDAVLLIKNNKITFIIINVAYFAVVIIGMLIIRSNPKLQQQLLDLVGNAFSNGPMQFLVGAYTRGEIINATVFTFFINLLVGCFISISLPSMIIPFSGYLVGGLRAIMWGFLFSPDLADLTLLKILAGIGIGLLLILEGEGYVLALFACFLHGRAWLIPSSVGAETAWAGYMAGIRLSLRLYMLIISVLLIAAIYEVVLSIFILPALI
jgi:hypothetical protein